MDRLTALAAKAAARWRQRSDQRPVRRQVTASLATEDVVWALGSFCALNRKPFDPELLVRQFPPPYTADSLIHAARALGFRIKRSECEASAVASLSFPCMALLHRQEPPAPESPVEETLAAADESQSESPADAPSAAPEPQPADAAIPAQLPVRPAIVIQADEKQVVLFEAGTNTPSTLPLDEFAARYAGIAFQLAPEAAALRDPDAVRASASEFGFRWFVPELLKHRQVWRDVLIASLVIQLLALSMPLFTQVVIDKVIVHRTESTLIVIAVGLVVINVFTSLLSWVRQYLVLHTGNRVDAVLGAAVFEHLFKLPPRYFEQRPTGVITARLRGVETIREFVASAAVTLILDLPFLLIFVGIMLYYSVTLTMISLAMIGAIMILSLIMAPVFRNRLNEQFLLGARNQAFTTEYVAGLETVKSLQMEPQIKAKYHDYLADYLRSGFGVRQIANTYNVVANALEQGMTLLILVAGAYIVMQRPDFTVGMLVAFQMFAGRVSQPLLRIVGLWQQFQQARMSVERLGDIMNAPPEPYAVTPSRVREGQGLIEIEELGFRYADTQPFLYQQFNLTVQPGRVVAIMGPSGSGKSTLAKLLQGFYQPVNGAIRLDGTDLRHLSANELRHTFGVVPQETILFSGTVYDNLQMANPHATFDDIVRACRMAEIHDAIEKLPKGYQTEIGERGAGLSGGQKQRIAIARALLKQPKILLFDEATSSLDMQTAEHFAATINQFKGKVTMLFIAHSLPRNLHVDEVVRIGSGHVATVGVAQAMQSE